MPDVSWRGVRMCLFCFLQICPCSYFVCFVPKSAAFAPRHPGLRARDAILRMLVVGKLRRMISKSFYDIWGKIVNLGKHIRKPRRGVFLMHLRNALNTCLAVGAVLIPSPSPLFSLFSLLILNSLLVSVSDYPLRCCSMISTGKVNG